MRVVKQTARSVMSVHRDRNFPHHWWYSLYDAFGNNLRDSPRGYIRKEDAERAALAFKKAAAQAELIVEDAPRAVYAR